MSGRTKTTLISLLIAAGFFVAVIVNRWMSL